MTDKSSPQPISRLYSRYLTPAEKQALRHVPTQGVSSEINLVRFLTVQFMQVQQSAPSDLISRMQALRTCTMLFQQLAVLVRACARSRDPQGEMDEILDQALDALPFFEDDSEEKK